LTLAPAIKSLQVQSLLGNKLSVYSNYIEIEKTLELNSKYLENKSEVIFGKRLQFQISDQIYVNKELFNLSNQQSKNTNDEKQKEFDDSYEKIIETELGGKRIN